MVVEAETNEAHALTCTAQDCEGGVAGIRDALYVLGGKWKLPLIFSLSGGPMRFRDLQRALKGITPKMLSRELKELELNGFVVRHEASGNAGAITYHLTPYSRTLRQVTHELKVWGTQHRRYIGASRKVN